VTHPAAWLWLATAIMLLPGARASAGTDESVGSVPLALDLAAAALRAGQSVAAAFALVSAAAPQAQRLELERVVAQLRAGAEPLEAWTVVDAASPLAVVARVAGRSIVSGARLAGALEHAARELRREAAGEAQERAHRAGVHAVAPLALCFLPSFVCIGIVPAIVGLAGPALHAAP
jgi:pilus assembly protein TadC